MIINHNIAALNTHRQMGSAQSAQMDSMEKLSSGLRINSAKDDAAGLTISEKMRGQIRGLEQASTNAQDGISLIQTAEGALNETHDILQRMRELAVQSANDTNTTTDRGEIQKEVNELAKEITRISNNTEFNTKKILNGVDGETLNFQIGANAGQTVTLDIGAMDATTLKVGATGAGDAVAAAGDPTVAAKTSGGLDVSSTGAAATAAITIINDAIITVSAERSKLGANQNRLEHTINNLNTSSENITAAESRIRDVDYAEAA